MARRNLLLAGCGALALAGCTTAQQAPQQPAWAAYYGLPQYQPSGYTLSAPALPPGTYDVVVFVHSRVSGTFNMRRVVRVTF